MTLNTEPNIAQPDDFYQALIEAHAGLPESHRHSESPPHQSFNGLFTR